LSEFKKTWRSFQYLSFISSNISLSIFEDLLIFFWYLDVLSTRLQQIENSPFGRAILEGKFIVFLKNPSPFSRFFVLWNKVLD
jgi:hypothetical protein